MLADLTINDIDEKVQKDIYVQDYSPKQIIDGAKVVEVKNFISEDGDFSELLRIDENGSPQGFEEFKIAQINRTKMNPGAVKAWHLHFKQDEIWSVLPSGQILLGLYDIRKNSKTKGLTMRIVAGGGKTQLIFIPRGVAHGALALGKKPANIIYFMNQKFDINNPGEQRLKWDILGKDFWEAKKE
ncbi:MAG: dTDP-4-dehydrorhamnose 3,5-epimerase family protein [Candidatus Levybacteria bacterium]|nr:dTDP-4-dehydrorhamnose 3,5-epimerase family protein [Candidatus Levybacteria bacterium]